MKHRGFTLVELLVALFITAILFAMGYSALTQALTSRKQLDEQTARLNEVQQALRTIEQDFELMQPRPVRDVLGSPYIFPLKVNQNSTTSLSSSPQGLTILDFTRGSWTNPAGQPRSEMQRVSYLLRDDKLIREYFLELDTTGSTKAEQRELIKQVDSLSFRYMDDNHKWFDQWPTPPMQNLPPADLLRARPVAIEITLKLKDWGTLLRIIEVAA